MTFAEADKGPEIPVLRKIERRVCNVNHDCKDDDCMAEKEAQVSVAGGCDSRRIPCPQESRKGEGMSAIDDIRERVRMGLHLENSDAELLLDELDTAHIRCLQYSRLLGETRGKIQRWIMEMEADAGIREMAARRMAAKEAIERGRE